MLFWKPIDAEQMTIDAEQMTIDAKEMPIDACKMQKFKEIDVYKMLCITNFWTLLASLSPRKA